MFIHAADAGCPPPEACAKAGEINESNTERPRFFERASMPQAVRRSGGWGPSPRPGRAGAGPSPYTIGLLDDIACGAAAMATYVAPLREIRFVLNDVLGISELSALPGFEEATAETIDGLLDEAAKLIVG